MILVYVCGAVHMSYSNKGPLSGVGVLSTLGGRQKSNIDWHVWQQATIPIEPSQPQSLQFKKKISNSKHWVSHNEHRKIIIFSWSHPVTGSTKKIRLNSQAREIVRGHTQGDPGCCGNRLLRATKSRKIYPFSLCSGFISSKGKFPRWCFHILNIGLSPCFAKAQSPWQKMVFSSHWIAVCLTEFSFTITFSR